MGLVVPQREGEKTKKINQYDLAPLKQWLALAGWLSGEMSAVKTAQFLLVFSYQVIFVEENKKKKIDSFTTTLH